MLFVFLYGGFIEREGRFLRPSFIYFFTDEQADQQGDDARLRWVGNALRPEFRPAGLRWYADNSRETIRDDLMRNQLDRLGVVGRRPGEASQSRMRLRAARLGADATVVSDGV